MKSRLGLRVLSSIEGGKDIIDMMLVLSAMDKRFQRAMDKVDASMEHFTYTPQTFRKEVLKEYEASHWINRPWVKAIRDIPSRVLARLVEKET